MYLCGCVCFHGKYVSYTGGIGASGGCMEMGQIFPLK